jgi:hypothetical protein
MMCREDKDPLVGDELLEIALEAYHVCFTFTNSVLQIGAPFAVLVQGKSMARIDPSSKSGDFASLWPLIGKRVKAVVWNDTVRILLNGEEEEEIAIGASKGKFRGTIIGRHDMTVEDF